MSIICAFSSDFRELYKADIYRALALPVGHVLHFRYKKKYVDENLISMDAALHGRKVVIFYTHGNKDQTSKLTHIAIRTATIVDHEVSNETDVVHIYMKLERFCNFNVDSQNSAEKQPPVKFFSELNCTDTNNDDNWQARVSAIKDLLPELTYFQIKGISSPKFFNVFRKGGDKTLDLTYTNRDRSCYYRLRQGTRHVLHLTLGNPNGTISKIDISESGDDVAINVVKPMETSVQFDDLDVPLVVQNLQVYKKPALLTFQPVKTQGSLGEYATNVELELRSGLFKPISFGLLSVFALGAVFVVQPRTPDSVFQPIWVVGVAAAIFWIATSFLYYWFNKK